MWRAETGPQNESGVKCKGVREQITSTKVRALQTRAQCTVITLAQNPPNKGQNKRVRVIFTLSDFGIFSSFPFPRFYLNLHPYL